MKAIVKCNKSNSMEGAVQVEEIYRNSLMIICTLEN